MKRAIERVGRTWRARLAVVVGCALLSACFMSDKVPFSGADPVRDDALAARLLTAYDSRTGCEGSAWPSDGAFMFYALSCDATPGFDQMVRIYWLDVDDDADRTFYVVALTTLEYAFSPIFGFDVVAVSENGVTIYAEDDARADDWAALGAEFDATVRFDDSFATIAFTDPYSGPAFFAEAVRRGLYVDADGTPSGTADPAQTGGAGGNALAGDASREALKEATLGLVDSLIRRFMLSGRLEEGRGDTTYDFTSIQLRDACDFYVYKELSDARRHMRVSFAQADDDGVAALAANTLICARYVLAKLDDETREYYVTRETLLDAASNMLRTCSNLPCRTQETEYMIALLEIARRRELLDFDTVYLHQAAARELGPPVDGADEAIASALEVFR